MSGFVPIITLQLGTATDFAWWHPGVILVVMSAVTLVAALAAGRRTTPAAGLSPEAGAAA